VSFDAAPVLVLDDLVERIATRVVELLIERDKPSVGQPGFVTASDLAAQLGVARSFIYAHADELGAMRLGDGPRAALRFDVERAREAIACSARESSQGENTRHSKEAPRSSRGGRRRVPNGLPSGSVLAVRGRPTR
jgi:hypothetical protein